MLTHKNNNTFFVETDKLTIITQKSSLENAVQICRQLGGQMPMSESVSDLENLMRKISNVDNEICDANYWIPIVRSATNKSIWESIQDKRNIT